MFVFSSVSVDCLYIYMWLSLLQTWVYQHFRGIGNMDAWGGYRERQHPRAMLFVPLVGLSAQDEYRGHLDLAGIIMALYGEHRHACPFERVSLYFGWLRYGKRKVRYLPERVLRQFGYLQTVPRHPHESAPPQATLVDITYRFQHQLDHVLTPQQLGHRALQGVEAEEGYIR
jgi:hypothetical protein